MSQAMSCWCRKKFIGELFNLHELAAEPAEAAADKMQGIGKGEAFRCGTLFPRPAETPQDGGDVVLVDIAVAPHEARIARPGCMEPDDLHLVRKAYLGVGDKKGREEGMGMAAARAADTADTDPERAVRGLHCADVGSMPCKGSAVPAYRADQQPRVNGFHRIIIGFLRIWIAIWRFNCYHYVADAGNAPVSVREGRGLLWSVWPLPSVYATEGIIIRNAPLENSLTENPSEYFQRGIF